MNPKSYIGQRRTVEVRFEGRLIGDRRAPIQFYIQTVKIPPSSFKTNREHAFQTLSHRYTDIKIQSCWEVKVRA